MPTVMQVIHTLVSRLLLIIFLAICLIPGLICMLMPMDYKIDSWFYRWFMDFFYRGALFVTLLPIRYRGVENIPANQPAIFAANHQSTIDIPLIGVLAHRHPHVWLAKKELTEELVFKFVVPRFTTLIDMSTPIKAMRSLLAALNMINDGKKRHVFIFPEGTRHTDGSVHEFYPGFVILAQKTKRPVIPIRIFGANKAYPPGTFWIHYNPITVVVGQPMWPGDNEDEDAFKARVYKWFLATKED